MAGVLHSEKAELSLKRALWGKLKNAENKCLLYRMCRPQCAVLVNKWWRGRRPCPAELVSFGQLCACVCVCVCRADRIAGPVGFNILWGLEYFFYIFTKNKAQSAIHWADSPFHFTRINHLSHEHLTAFPGLCITVPSIKLGGCTWPVVHTDYVYTSEWKQIVKGFFYCQYIVEMMFKTFTFWCC